MQTINNRQLIEDVFQYDVVLFGMGINNSTNNGFSYDIAINFPEVKDSENNTGYGDLRKYGKIHETVVNEKLSFCACYCYNIGLKKRNNGVFIDYDKLEECLTSVKAKYKGKKIASPIIGQDIYDGNGDKARLLDIFAKVFGGDTDLTLYDFEQGDFKRDRYQEAVNIRYEYAHGMITKDEFKHRRKYNEWKRLHGIFEPMPEDFEYKPRRKSQGKIFNKNDK